jgi:hypothetical protein
VIVYYDLLNPAENSADDFHAISVRDLLFVPFCALALVGIPLFIFLQRRA